jgi:hypothetical protein
MVLEQGYSMITEQLLTQQYARNVDHRMCFLISEEYGLANVYMT